ncbi:MAG: hypothetical protein Q8K23_03965 [Sulfuritalea sp.]|nr:hypothetical protein [Sulfuritalea sp.]
MSDPNSLTSKKPKCMPCLATLVVGLLLLAIAFGGVSLVVQKVFTGAGLEYCCAIEGVRFNYIAVFVLICGAAVALLFAVVLQVRDWQVRRDFERKYGVKVPASTATPGNFSGADSGPSLHGVEYGDGD